MGCAADKESTWRGWISRSGHVCFRCPSGVLRGWRGRVGCALSGSDPKMGALHDWVANYTTTLTFAKIGLWGTISRWAIGTRCSRWKTRVVATRLLRCREGSSSKGDICRDGMRPNGRLLLGEKELAIDKFLMQLVKGNRSFSTFNNIHNMAIIIIEALQDKFKKIHMIEWFAETGEFIGATFDKLHELWDRTRALWGTFQLILNLFDVSTSGTSICVGKNKPSFMRGGGSLNQRNERGCNGAYKSAKQ